MTNAYYTNQTDTKSSNPIIKLKNWLVENRLLQLGSADISFTFFVVVLLVIGLLMLFSASTYYALHYENNQYHFIIRQLIFAFAGLIIMYITSRIDYHVYRKLAWVIYGFSLILLVIVLILPPLKDNFHRWINLGLFTFQPSEIAKFAVIVLLAALISTNYKRMEKFSYGIVFLGLLLLIPCGLVVVETHISGTILIFGIGLCLMIVGGVKLRYILVPGGILGGGAAALIFSGAISYGKGRIDSWLNPWSDLRGLGYQTAQGLMAIGSGGLLGRGIGKSQQKFLWLPELQNDFIFPIVCEEVGFIGAIIIITLFVLLLWRGFTIAMRAPDKFGSFLALGMTFQVGLQAAFNIMVVTNTIPNTGISLPFFSYGGTSLLMLLAQMGIVISVSRASTVMKR